MAEKVYKISAQWSMFGTYNIEAESLQDAIDIIKSPGPGLPDCDYLDDSLIIDEDKLIEDYPDEMFFGKDCVIWGNIKVELVDLGEGLCGDYNPEDPDDVELFRFDVSYRDEHGNWNPIPDSSYCTRLRVNIPEKLKKKALIVLIKEYHNAVGPKYTELSPSVKKLGERLSWICEGDFKQ